MYVKVIISFNFQVFASSLERSLFQRKETGQVWDRMEWEWFITCVTNNKQFYVRIKYFPIYVICFYLRVSKANMPALANALLF